MSSVVSKQALQALRKRMPYGYRRLAVARLAAKGKVYSGQAVANTAQGLTYVHEIFLELVAIAEAYEAQQRQLDEMAKGTSRLVDTMFKAAPHEPAY